MRSRFSLKPIIEEKIFLPRPCVTSYDLDREEEKLSKGYESFLASSAFQYSAGSQTEGRNFDKENLFDGEDEEENKNTTRSGNFFHLVENKLCAKFHLVKQDVVCCFDI